MSETDFFNAWTEACSGDERAAYQSEWLAELVARASAYANAPASRRILDAAGIAPEEVTTLEALERVPITRKDELLDLQRADPALRWLPRDPHRRTPRSRSTRRGGGCTAATPSAT